MKSRFIYLPAYFALLSATMAFGQRPVARIAELEGDERYGVLTDRYDALSVKEDSVGARIDDIRKIFAGDVPGKEQYSDELISLEMEHYRLRDTLDNIAREINTIEQEWSIRNVRSGRGGESPTPVHNSRGKPYLVHNDFFKETLPHEDYGQLLRAQEMEREAERLIVSIKANYDRMAAVAPVYRNAGKEQADSLYGILSGLAAENDDLAGRMRVVWNEVFDSKVYLYNYILDKTGMSDTMAEMERLMVDVSLRSAETEGQYMYDAVAAYPFRKSLLLRYETSIASARGLNLAADSLRATASEVAALDRYLLPVIDTEERLFLDYSDIAVARPPKYNSANPIPRTEIYAKGLIYRILLGIYSTPRPVSLFKGVYPLSVERKEDGKYYYYAGGFASYEESEKAAERLKQAGFGNPRIAAWYNGEYYDTDNAKNTPQQSKGAKTKYRVEITGAADGLSERVRAVIGEMAPGKEISKVPGQDGLSPVFIIGSFDDQGAARSVAAAVTSADPGLDAGVDGYQ
jgi:hypothetical protein